MSDLDLFEEFWNIGMRKANKKGAKKAFDKTIKGMSALEKREFMDMLKQDIPWRLKNQFGFDKLHPASYLNGERWEDEKVIEKKKTGFSLEDIFSTDWGDDMIDKRLQ